MFLRVTAAKGHRYVQLVRNYRDQETGVTKTQVLHSFGREDQLDRAALTRLVKSVSRFLASSEEAPCPPAGPVDTRVEFQGARDLGGVWVLDHLWHDLKLDVAVRDAIQPQEARQQAERWLFAAVAACALAPHEPLPLEDWSRRRAYVPGLVSPAPDGLRDATRTLLASLRGVEHGLQGAVASLHRPSGETLFFGTVGATLASDRPAASGGPGPKHITLGLVVTHEGMPVRLWAWPGNRTAPQLAEQVKRALDGSGLGRMVAALGTGLDASGRLQGVGGDGHLLIVCDKLAGGQSNSPTAPAPPASELRRQRSGPEVREVTVDRAGTRLRATIVYNFPIRETSDELPAGDIALGLRLLDEAAAAYGVLKQTLDQHTAYAGDEDRLRLHALVRWLALLLVRAAELRAGKTWAEIRATAETLQAGIYHADGVATWQSSTPTEAMRGLLAALASEAPPRCLKVEPIQEPR